MSRRPDVAACDRGAVGRGSRRKPSFVHLLAEPWQASVSLNRLVWSGPLLWHAPRGDGHTVLVLPGLLADDHSTIALRRFLRSRDLDAVGWGLGRNEGPTSRVVQRLPDRLAQLADQSGGPVSIVGWSLGGLFAREIARQRPDLVRQVITLASPIGMVEESRTWADRAYRSHARRHVDSWSRSSFGLPLSVPSTSIYSFGDGVVGWRDCVLERSHRHENIAVTAGHLGMGFDPWVMWLVAERLSQPSGQWRRFEPVRPVQHRFLVAG